MQQRKGRMTHALLFGAAGWLFADLLLALAMLFLVANSVGHVPPPPTPTPPATPIPTATPSFILSTNYTPITIGSIQYGGLVQTPPDPAAIQDAQTKIEQKVRPYAERGECAGIVLVYGGGAGPDGSDGQAISQVFLTVVLPQLGAIDSMFKHAKYYHSLTDFGVTPDVVELDIFMYPRCPFKPGA